MKPGLIVVVALSVALFFAACAGDEKARDNPIVGEFCDLKSDCGEGNVCCSAGEYGPDDLSAQISGTCVPAEHCVPNFYCRDEAETARCTGDDVCCDVPWGALYPLCIPSRLCVFGSGGNGAGTGGGAATGGAAGVGGGMGVGGAGGMDACLPPFNVLSGDLVIDNEGCIDATAMGQLPTTIVLDEAIDSAETVRIEGRFAPIAGGVAVDPVGLVSACFAGVVNGMSVEQCLSARALLNTVDNTGAVAIYDPSFVEVEKADWQPTSNMAQYVLTISVDPAAETLTVALAIDGVEVATATASSLGPPGGDVLSVLVSKATVCKIVRTGG